MAIYLFCRGELVTAFESNVFAIGTWNLQRWSSVHGGRYLGSCHCRLHNHSGRLPWREQASQCHHVAKPPHRPSSHRGNCVYIRFNVLSRNMAGIYVKEGYWVDIYKCYLLVDTNSCSWSNRLTWRILYTAGLQSYFLKPSQFYFW